jgi:lysophospholipase L1-like esterase
MFRKKGRHLQPDYVTLFFGWNDHWLCGFKPDSAALSIEMSPRAAAAYELMRRKLVGQLLFRLMTRGQNMALPTKQGKLAADIEDQLRVPQAEYRQVLKMLAAEIRSVGAIPVFITAPRSTNLTHLLVYNGQAKSVEGAAKLHDEYCEITREVAQSTDSVLLDLRAMFVNPDENGRLFGKDGIHFTQPGLWRVAEELYKTIRSDASPASYATWLNSQPPIDATLSTLADTWTGMVENDTNQFNLTLQIESPAVSNDICATFRLDQRNEGSLQFVRLEGRTVICTGTTAHAECPVGADDQLRLLPDGSLLYSSRSEFGMTIGPLRKRK